MCSLMPGSKCFVVLALLVAACACRLEIATADEQLPFLRLEEDGGHLAFKSCLPAGRGDFTADDDAGMRLHGFVFVTGKDEEKRARIFRLKGTLAADETDGAAAPTGPLGATEFFVNLQATPNPDHYLLHIKVAVMIDGETVQEEARLGRNCCGYYVAATRGGVQLPPGRAPLLRGLMVEAAETYRQFERLAQACNRSGFEFVPVSQFSPTVVSEIVAAERSRPGPAVIERLQTLVAELDSDQFSRREAATGDLVREGRTTVWFLDHLSSGSLSAEQSDRLGRVRNALREYSQPRLPFVFSHERIRELAAAPPAAWLQQLRDSSDAGVRQWVRDKLLLSGSTPAVDSASVPAASR